MKTLIIYSHPNHNSLNYSFLQKTIKGLESNNKITDIQTIDLYDESFDPALIFNENQRRRDVYRHPETEEYRQAIKNADHIVMVYPIWWGRPPAMILGFIDKLFATNFAYRYKKGGLFPEGLLKGKKVHIVSTMKGPDHYMRFFLGNAHQILMRRALFNFVGIKKVKIFEFGSMESNAKKRKKRLLQIEKYFSTIS